MDTALIIGIGSALLLAAGVYVVMEYHHFGEPQKASNQLLKQQTEAAAVRKELGGYTKYAEYLPQAKAHLADKAHPDYLAGLEATGIGSEAIAVEQPMYRSMLSSGVKSSDALFMQ